MIIETRHLTKIFNGNGGCRDVTLSVDEGEVFGFLGPNGAGKSTLIKTLVGLCRPSSGEGSVLSRPIGDVNARRSIGYLPELFRFQDYLTPQELLRFHARLYKMDMSDIDGRIDKLLDLCGIGDHKRQQIRTFSKGMQQRLGLASALLPSPKLVFLDEPTSALDPVGRRDVRNIIEGLKNDGVTVFLNSHLLSEVELTCDHVAIIDNGHIIASGSLDELMKKNKKLEIRLGGVDDAALSALKDEGRKVTIHGGILEITIEGESEIPGIVRTIAQNGGNIYEVGTSKTNLEDIFIGMIDEEREGSGSNNRDEL